MIRSIDDLDEYIERFYKERAPRSSVVTVQPTGPATVQEPGEPRSRHAAIYFNNYGNHYRAMIAPLSDLGVKVDPVIKGKFSKDVPARFHQVLLTKRGKEDAVKSLKMQDLDPAQYITPASSSTTDAGNMKQGVVYVVTITLAGKKIYSSFFKKKKEIPVENDGYVECTCEGCNHVDKNDGAFTCKERVFTNPKPVSEITNKIFCNKHDA